MNLAQPFFNRSAGWNARMASGLIASTPDFQGLKTGLKDIRAKLGDKAPPELSALIDHYLGQEADDPQQRGRLAACVARLPNSLWREGTGVSFKEVAKNYLGGVHGLLREVMSQDDYLLGEDTGAQNFVAVISGGLRKFLETIETTPEQMIMGIVEAWASQMAHGAIATFKPDLSENITRSPYDVSLIKEASDEVTYLQEVLTRLRNAMGQCKDLLTKPTERDYKVALALAGKLSLFLCDVAEKGDREIAGMVEVMSAQIGNPAIRALLEPAGLSFPVLGQKVAEPPPHGTVAASGDVGGPDEDTVPTTPIKLDLLKFLAALPEGEGMDPAAIRKALNRERSGEERYDQEEITRNLNSIAGPGSGWAALQDGKFSITEAGRNHLKTCGVGSSVPAVSDKVQTIEELVQLYRSSHKISNDAKVSEAIKVLRLLAERSGFSEAQVVDAFARLGLERMDSGQNKLSRFLNAYCHLLDNEKITGQGSQSLMRRLEKATDENVFPSILRVLSVIRSLPDEVSFVLDDISPEAIRLEDSSTYVESARGMGRESFQVWVGSGQEVDLDSSSGGDSDRTLNVVLDQAKALIDSEARSRLIVCVQNAKSVSPAAADRFYELHPHGHLLWGLEGQITRLMPSKAEPVEPQQKDEDAIRRDRLLSEVIEDYRDETGDRGLTGQGSYLHHIKTIYEAFLPLLKDKGDFEAAFSEAFDQVMPNHPEDKSKYHDMLLRVVARLDSPDVRTPVREAIDRCLKKMPKVWEETGTRINPTITGSHLRKIYFDSCRHGKGLSREEAFSEAYRHLTGITPEKKSIYESLYRRLFLDLIGELEVVKAERQVNSEGLTPVPPQRWNPEEVSWEGIFAENNVSRGILWVPLREVFPDQEGLRGDLSFQNLQVVFGNLAFGDLWAGINPHIVNLGRARHAFDTATELFPTERTAEWKESIRALEMQVLEAFDMSESQKEGIDRILRLPQIAAKARDIGREIMATELAGYQAIWTRLVKNVGKDKIPEILRRDCEKLASFEKRLADGRRPLESGFFEEWNHARSVMKSWAGFINENLKTIPSPQGYQYHSRNELDLPHSKASYKEIVAFLEKYGFVYEKKRGGVDVIYVHSETGIRAVVPLDLKEGNPHRARNFRLQAIRSVEAALRRTAKMAPASGLELEDTQEPIPSTGQTINGSHNQGKT